MLLSAHMLDGICNVNLFQYVDQASLTQGSATEVCFQLINASLNTPNQGYSPSGLRYIPPVGSTLQVTLTNIDSSVQITRYATQMFPTQDGSIWCVQIFSTDKIYGTCDLTLVLSELGHITTGKAINMFAIQSAGQF